MLQIVFISDFFVAHDRHHGHFRSPKQYGVGWTSTGAPMCLNHFDRRVKNERGAVSFRQLHLIVELLCRTGTGDGDKHRPWH
jgi:hypothetical protein